jgi:outer membrane protein assembly factor BamB
MRTGSSGLGFFLMAGAAVLAAPVPGKFQAQEHDWPQWLGARRDGLSRETGLLQEWPRGGPRLLWKTRGLGRGYSTPSVAAGRVFTMGNRRGKEYVLAFDELTGKRLWATALGPVRSSGGGFPGPRSTPTVDGEWVYALGLAGDLACLEASTGKRRWQRNLRRRFGGQAGTWGYSESPLVDGDRVVCTPGGRRATLVALRKQTGKTIWRAAVPGGDTAAYSSVVIADAGGRRQYVQFLSGGLVGVSARRGRFLWRYRKPANSTANCCTPVVSGQHVFAASGYDTGGGLVKLSRGGRARQVYFTRAMKNQHGGMVLVDGHLYGCTDPGLLVCLDFKTGRVRWKSRHPGKGSLAYADGRLYYRNEGGPLILVEANPRRYEERGYLSQPARSGSRAWPYPVIANGRLYLRDQGVLLCYDVKRAG